MTMVFRLCLCAEKTWRKLDGSKYLTEVIKGVRFVNEMKQKREAA